MVHLPHHALPCFQNLWCMPCCSRNLPSTSQSGFSVLRPSLATVFVFRFFPIENHRTPTPLRRTAHDSESENAHRLPLRSCLKHCRNRIWSFEKQCESLSARTLETERALLVVLRGAQAFKRAQLFSCLFACVAKENPHSRAL